MRYTNAVETADPQTSQSASDAGIAKKHSIAHPQRALDKDVHDLGTTVDKTTLFTGPGFIARQHVEDRSRYPQATSA